ncbi:hypothetical protein T10_7721 [Trichinella papuae]|uniref:Uncharacterized protein n=1 Tax=Trichinella papuae TaxID=268474 RepID=A0A0V1MYI4_9BILA|nr:hypothetical protein T10_7721 [Trichinella papuae]
MLLCSIIYNKQQNLPTGVNCFQAVILCSTQSSPGTLHATAYDSNEMKNNIFSIGNLELISTKTIN